MKRYAHKMGPELYHLPKTSNKVDGHSSVLVMEESGIGA